MLGPPSNSLDQRLFETPNFESLIFAGVQQAIVACVPEPAF